MNGELEEKLKHSSLATFNPTGHQIKSSFTSCSVLAEHEYKLEKEPGLANFTDTKQHKTSAETVLP